MKKLFLTMLGAALISGPALYAQSLDGVGLTVEKVNVAKLKSNIAKSDAEIADAKKNVKAAIWIKRGDVFWDADAKPVNGLFVGLEDKMLKSTWGDAAPAEETIGGTTYTVYTYEHFKTYLLNGRVEIFVPVTIIDPAALDKAYDAYDKAYTLDAKGAAKKVKVGMDNIYNKSMENGGNYYSLNDYTTAAENFRRAYKAGIHPALAKADSLVSQAIFYAGMTGVFGGDYQTALGDLDKTLERGYDAGGETYRLKFLAMYNLGEKEKSVEILQNAVKMYPTNEDLIDMLMRYYAENEGDPSSLIPLVRGAIDNNPTNASLWQGLARVYDKLGQNDNAIEAIKKSVELTPNDFLASYLEGLFIVKKGDKMNDELGKMTITSRAQYQEALAAVNEVFASALPALERAYEIDPSEIATVELLKNLTYRLRDDAAFNEKYEKYNALFNSMNNK